MVFWVIRSFGSRNGIPFIVIVTVLVFSGVPVVVLKVPVIVVVSVYCVFVILFMVIFVVFGVTLNVVVVFVAEYLVFPPYDTVMLLVPGVVVL